MFDDKVWCNLHSQFMSQFSQEVEKEPEIKYNLDAILKNWDYKNHRPTLIDYRPPSLFVRGLKILCGLKLLFF